MERRWTGREGADRSITMIKKQKNRINGEIGYQLSGWILFLGCALFFIASGWENNDMLTFTGSIIFLIACILFLIPLVKEIKKTDDDSTMGPKKGAMDE